MLVSKRIVFVDDDPLDTNLALEALAECQLSDEVISFNDGFLALDYLCCRGQFQGRCRVNPAVVLMDLKMPKIDGIEVLKQIRGDSELSTIPVVIMTSSKESVDVCRSYESGANGYVVKPVQFDEFSETVKQIGQFWAITNEPPPGAIRRMMP